MLATWCGSRSIRRPGTNSAGVDLRSSSRRGPTTRRPGLVIACPITNHAKGYPFEVPIPSGGAGAVTGVVLADHVKNLDWQARRVVLSAKAGPEIVTEVRERLRVLVGL